MALIYKVHTLPQNAINATGKLLVSYDSTNSLINFKFHNFKFTLLMPVGFAKCKKEFYSTDSFNNSQAALHIHHPTSHPLCEAGYDAVNITSFVILLQIDGVKFAANLNYLMASAQLCLILKCRRSPPNQEKATK